MTQMALGGAGVERNGTESPGHLMPLLRIPYALLRNCEIITGITGGIYPDRAAKQQTPVMPVIISVSLKSPLLFIPRAYASGKTAPRIARRDSGVASDARKRPSGMHAKTRSTTRRDSWRSWLENRTARPVLRVRSRAQKVPAVFHIEEGRRLVQQEDIGPAGQGGGDARKLELAVAEGGNVGPGQTVDPEQGQ